MPANQIKHDVKEGKGSKKSLEKKWKEAEDIVKDEYGTDDGKWGIVQKIYQNKREASVITRAFIDAAAKRIRASVEIEIEEIQKKIKSLKSQIVKLTNDNSDNKNDAEIERIREELNDQRQLMNSIK